MELAEISGDGPLRVEVREGGNVWATVHLEAGPFPYVYPVLAPGGVPVTRGFPMDPQANEEPDHPHHRSLWFAHGAVNGLDFWHGPDGERIEHREILAASSGPEAALRTRSAWLAPDGAVVLEEVRTVRFSSSTSLGLEVADSLTSWRAIDVEIELTAASEAVTFEDTKEGTFAVRVHPELRAEGEVAAGTLRNEHGDEGRAAWGKPARWIHDAGPVGDAEVGVAMFDHPGNLRHPTWWHARSYGLLAANPFGQHDFEDAPEGSGDFELAAGQSLALRYRVVVHRGSWSSEAVGDAYRQFVDRFGEE